MACVTGMRGMVAMKGALHLPLITQLMLSGEIHRQAEGYSCELWR